MESHYVRIIIRWLWLFILILIVAVISAIGFSSSQPPSYQAVTRLMIGPGITSPNPGYDELRTGSLLTQTYSELTRTQTFQEQVIDDLGLDMTALELSEIVDIRPIVDTQITNIVVTHPEPDMAIKIANQVGDNLVNLSPSIEYNTFLIDRIAEQAQRIEQDIVNIETRIADLNAQLETEDDISQQAVLTQSLVTEERRLAEANDTLASLYDALQRPFTNQVAIIDRATEAPEATVSLSLTIVIALSGGLLVCGMLAVLLIYLDTLLVNGETIQNYVETPVWAQISIKGTDPSADSLALGTRLTKLHDQSQINSVVLIGVDDIDDVPKLAISLAKTISKIDQKVSLLDVDFVNNTIDHEFSGKQFPTFKELAVSKNLGQNRLPDYPNLAVIPSGQGDIESIFQITAQYSKMMEKLKGVSDYVIVAAPSIRSSGQTTSFAGLTDGSLIIARHRKTRIADLRSAIKQLESVGASIRGLIVVK